uniref:Uncharacterized protein n=1 Tax=Cacopsylla melanoneura TaxID=428564 RepID=A0A8D9A565_9HEMI
MLNCFTVEGHVLTAMNGKLTTLEGHVSTAITANGQISTVEGHVSTANGQTLTIWRDTFKLLQSVKLPLWRDRFKLQRAKLPLWRDKVLVWRYECGQLVCLEHPLVHVQIVLVPHCL